MKKTLCGLCRQEIKEGMNYFEVKSFAWELQEWDTISNIFCSTCTKATFPSLYKHFEYHERGQY